MTAAVDLRMVAAEARFDAAYGAHKPIEWADLSQVSRDQWVADVDMAIVNAVATQVREQVAQEIEREAQFEGVRAQRVIGMCAYVARKATP